MMTTGIITLAAIGRSVAAGSKRHIGSRICCRLRLAARNRRNIGRSLREGGGGDGGGDGGGGGSGSEGAQLHLQGPANDPGM